MKKLIIGLVLLISGVVQAQESVDASDTLQVEKAPDFQLFVAPSFNFNQFVETGSNFVGGRVGLSYKKQLEVSVSYAFSVDQFNQQLIFPSSHGFDQQNMGAYAQYTHGNKRLRPLVGLGFDYGMVSWEPEHDSNDTFSDNVFIYSMYVGASWDLLSNLSIQADIGYNIGSDVELIGLESDDYDGLRGDILIKFYFLKF